MLMSKMRTVLAQYFALISPVLYRKLRMSGRQPHDFGVGNPIHLKSGKKIMIYPGYRKSLRPFWFRVFPPLRALNDLVNLGKASNQTIQTLKTAAGSDCLPLSVDEYIVLFSEEMKRNPELFYRDKSGGTLFHIKEPEKTLRKRLQRNDNNINYIIKCVYEQGLSFQESDILDVGCGSGDLCYRLLAADAMSVTGIDISFDHPDDYYLHRQNSLRIGDKAPRFITGSASNMPFPDENFEVVVSTSVLEHLAFPLQSFQEMYRVLKDDGICIHFYDPYFSPKGGHSLITLDFPWGHVLLNHDEIVDYIGIVRQYEFDRAMQFLSCEIPSVSCSITEMQEYIIKAGFHILSWEEGLRKSHMPLITAALLEEAKKNYPAVTVRDLLVDAIWMVLKK